MQPATAFWVKGSFLELIGSKLFSSVFDRCIFDNRLLPSLCPDARGVVAFKPAKTLGPPGPIELPSLSSLLLSLRLLPHPAPVLLFLD